MCLPVSCADQNADVEILVDTQDHVLAPKKTSTEIYVSYPAT